MAHRPFFPPTPPGKDETFSLLPPFSGPFPDSRLINIQRPQPFRHELVDSLNGLDLPFVSSSLSPFSGVICARDSHFVLREAQLSARTQNQKDKFGGHCDNQQPTENCKTALNAMTRRTSTGLITPPYTSEMIDHYTPSSKCNSSIAELCAQTVCFLWFESLPTLHEAATSNFPHHTRIPDIDNMAKAEFTKWTRDVLSTTQVSTNVVILAMLYIYRLKVGNPSVKGKAGSEYRLLTVALMLGNKFLDDNTYTNRTWADVTNIAVKEIHLMEVEFLSNMRYQLMVTVDEWHQWINKINLFVRYQQKQQTMCHATSLPRGLPSPPVLYDQNWGNNLVNNNMVYPALRLDLPQTAIRSRKRSLGDTQFPDAYDMLPPLKKMLSQPSTPRRTEDVLNRARYPTYASGNNTSPSRHQQLQASLLRTLPPLAKYPLSVNSTYSVPQYQSMPTKNALSPSYLQVSNHIPSGSSPTNSTISHFSNHSHGPALGYSPTSLALQYRNSPYAPVQPVQKLVGKYQPIFNSLQVDPQTKQSLWYNQVSAGSQQPIYHGHVPLSAQAFAHGGQAKYLH